MNFRCYLQRNTNAPTKILQRITHLHLEHCWQNRTQNRWQNCTQTLSHADTQMLDWRIGRPSTFAGRREVSTAGRSRMNRCQHRVQPLLLVNRAVLPFIPMSFPRACANCFRTGTFVRPFFFFLAAVRNV